MTIVTWPLATRERVVHAFNPARRPSAEGPFRTLRDHGWATSGVRVSRRVAGRLAGQLTVFSSLNVEAARLARLGQGAEARKAASAIEFLEAGQSFQKVRRLLTELPDGVAQNVINGVMGEDLPNDLVIALEEVARDTERVRVSISAWLGLWEVLAGHVMEVHDGYVLLAVHGGSLIPVPLWMAAAARRERVGQLLALVIDKLDATSAVTEAVPAIAYEDDRPADDFSPFGRLDRRASRIAPEDEKLLRGEPIPLRILVPVNIGT